MATILRPDVRDLRSGCVQTLQHLRLALQALELRNPPGELVVGREAVAVALDAAEILESVAGLVHDHARSPGHGSHRVPPEKAGDRRVVRYRHANVLPARDFADPPDMGARELEVRWRTLTQQLEGSVHGSDELEALRLNGYGRPDDLLAPRAGNGQGKKDCRRRGPRPHSPR